MGEFGRTPKINGNAGRDHWPHCYSIVLAGGGVRGGTTFGSSDKLGAYPDTDAVTPADLAATLFWRFGLDPVRRDDRPDRPPLQARRRPATSDDLRVINKGIAYPRSMRPCFFPAFSVCSSCSRGSSERVEIHKSFRISYLGRIHSSFCAFHLIQSEFSQAE